MFPLPALGQAVTVTEVPGCLSIQPLGHRVAQPAPEASGLEAILTSAWSPSRIEQPTLALEFPDLYPLVQR